MKTKAIILAVSLIAFSVIAHLSVLFQGWDRLKESSPDIIIARCGEPTPPTPGIDIVNGPNSDSTIDVIAVLKGTNSLGESRLWTDHAVWPGEKYLIFGYHQNGKVYGVFQLGGVYQANEEYRVIPLGASFSTNLIAGKTLDEQLQILFKLRLENLNQEIQAEQEEKQRLEEGIKKQASKKTGVKEVGKGSAP